jgi:hypothetical protein
MDSIFNNREIASMIWLIIFAILVVSKSGRRSAFRSLSGLVRNFFKWVIVVPLLSMILYMAILIFVLGIIGFWDVSALKDTVFWVLGVAIIGMFCANDVGKKEGFFREMILNNLKLIAVLEFILNIYTFNLWIELLLLVPSLTIVRMLKTVSEFKVKTESGYSQVDSVLGYLLGLTGIVLAIIAIYKTINNFNEFATIYTLRDFLLPVVLSVLYLPFVYAWALFLAYDNLFRRINVHNNDQSLARHLKKPVLMTFHVRLWRLLQWSRQPNSLHINSREDATALIKQSMADE